MAAPEGSDVTTSDAIILYEFDRVRRDRDAYRSALERIATAELQDGQTGLWRRMREVALAALADAGTAAGKD